ncbi:P22 coat - protein 5 family protein, partial [Acinetobacter baumannii]
VLLDVHGFAIRESAKIATPAIGTGASATTNTAGYAVGATVITLASAGTGTILAGDIITFAGDTNRYVVAQGNASVAAGGTITLAAPGLRKA